ncbi:MAG: type I-C CRISPR-associated protein Cas8c/Csd1 [Candidatus Hydrogenedentes bacterium]|nr:type I-C CRISPR-associated protein Cas8c/Csd1 [Candidatus Hydrogenedentota bacterium]
MILQSLHELADREGLVEDADYEWKPVTWLIHLDEKGKFLNFVGTQYTPPEEGKKKPKPVSKKFAVPRCGGRTSGDFAFFLVDKADYVLGLDPEGKRPVEKRQARAQLFRDEVRACYAATKSPAVGAVLQFLEERIASLDGFTLPEDCTPSDLFGFIVRPQRETLITDEDAVRKYWEARRGADAGNQGMCLVLGEEAPLAELFPGIKRVPGGTTSGTGLVSFNASAFCSYGWKNNENAPISRKAAEACGTALNRLLDPACPDPRDPDTTLPLRHYRLGGDSVVAFWERGEGSTEPVNQFAGMLDADPSQVHQLYHSVWTGITPDVPDTAYFYALTISGAQGRAMIRDWLDLPLKKAMAAIARHFADIEVVRNTPPAKKNEHPPSFSLRALLNGLAVNGKSDDVPPPLAASMLHSVFSGDLYPLSAYQRAIGRYRSEIGNDEWLDLNRRDARVALIKGVLNRNYGKELKRSMDRNIDDPGYLLGRLMAVIERTQQVALGDVNASVIDRFFAGASATPRAVFTRLLKNMRHHVSKARDDEKSRGSALWLDREADDILSRLGPQKPGYGKVNTGLPLHLNLEQQGLFIIGYHHERHWLWQKKEDREE